MGNETLKNKTVVSLSIFVETFGDVDGLSALAVI